jgi:hypothetical protein
MDDCKGDGAGLLSLNKRPQHTFHTICELPNSIEPIATCRTFIPSVLCDTTLLAIVYSFLVIQSLSFFHTQPSKLYIPVL